MLTRSGWVVLVSGLVLLGLAWGLDYPELLVVACGCACALLLAGVWMLRRPTLRVAREIRPRRVSEGELASAILTLHNDSAHRTPPMVAEEQLGKRAVTVWLPSLKAGTTHAVSFGLPTGRRGIYTVGPLSVGHTDPMRLMRVGEQHQDRSTLWVHPRVHRVGPVPTGRTRDMDGRTTSSAPEGGIAFHSLREYVWGDDLRLVHWRSTAKTGQLMVRHHVVTNEPRLMVVLDTSAAPYADDSFEDAVRVAASLCIAAIDGHYPLTFRTTGGVVAVADGGPDDKMHVLDVLAGVEVSASDPGLDELVKMVPRDDGVSLGVVTGQPERRTAVSTVRPRFDMVSLVQVGEHFGRPAAPLSGALVVNVADSKEFARVWNQRVGVR